MNEDPSLPSSYVKMEGDSEMDYLAAFDPIDPQLGLSQQDDGIAPEKLSQFALSTPAWDNSDNLSLENFDSFDAAFGMASVPSESNNTATPSEASKKSRASSKSSAPSVEPASTALKPGKRKRAKPEDSEAAGNDVTKRSQSLKRNRIAASKCRQKKKVWQNTLEERKGELERRHAALQRDYNELLGEASQLKNSLMVHSGCGDPSIDAWIEKAAIEYIAKSTAQQPEEWAAGAGNAGRHGRNG